MNTAVFGSARRSAIEATLLVIPSMIRAFWEDRTRVLRSVYGTDFDDCEVCRATIAGLDDRRGETPTHLMVHREATFGLKIDAPDEWDLWKFVQILKSSMDSDVVETETLREAWCSLHAHAVVHHGWVPNANVALLYNQVALCNEGVHGSVMALKHDTWRALCEIANDLDADRFDIALQKAKFVVRKVEGGLAEIINSYAEQALSPH